MYLLFEIQVYLCNVINVVHRVHPHKSMYQSQRSMRRELRASTSAHSGKKFAKFGQKYLLSDKHVLNLRGKCCSPQVEVDL